MDNLKHPGESDWENAQEGNADRLVCSPEFTKGYTNPAVGAPPCLTPCADIPEVKPRPQPNSGERAEDELPPEPVKTHNATSQPGEGFPEIACSAEFPNGCVSPEGGEHHP